jgi:hypothetical protein
MIKLGFLAVEVEAQLKEVDHKLKAISIKEMKTLNILCHLTEWSNELFIFGIWFQQTLILTKHYELSF